MIVRKRTWAALGVSVALITAVVWRHQHAASSPMFQVARLEKGTIESRFLGTIQDWGSACCDSIDFQIGAEQWRPM